VYRPAAGHRRGVEIPINGKTGRLEVPPAAAGHGRRPSRTPAR
jgi:hypothetical protein